MIYAKISRVCKALNLLLVIYNVSDIKIKTFQASLLLVKLFILH